MLPRPSLVTAIELLRFRVRGYYPLGLFFPEDSSNSAISYSVSPPSRPLIYADWKTLIYADEFIRVNLRVFLSALIRDLVGDKIL